MPNVSSENLESKSPDKLRLAFDIFIQAFFLSHFINIFIHPYEEANLQVEALEKDSLLSLIGLFVLAYLLLFFLERNLSVEKRSSLNNLSYFLFATQLVFRSYQPALIASVIFISLALLIYKANYAWAYFLFLASYLIRYYYLIITDKIYIPQIFQNVSNKTFISRLSLISIAISILVLLLIFAYLKFIKKEINLNQRSIFVAALMFLLLAIFIHLIWQSLILLYKVLNMHTATYDMGIFTQMYHGILKTGKPVTTLERDQLLSHFKVHVSPILYLIVPIFKLFPYAATLEIMQVLLIAAAVIPFLLIAKELGFSRKTRVILASLYLFQTGLILSNMYNFHENVFLPLLIMFLFYFVLKGKYSGIITFSILIFMVKEDAFIYVLVIAIYLFLGAGKKDVSALEKKKARLTALVLGAVSVLAFVLDVYYLRSHGLGEMSSRFSNLKIHPDLGLLSIIIVIFERPVLFIETIFTPNKLRYLMIQFTSLGFIPLLNRKFYRLSLYLPLLVINLMSNYPYQHDIKFQYNYGSTSFLLVLSLLVLADYLLKAKKTETAVEAKETVEAPERKTFGYEKLMLALILIAFISGITYNVSYFKNYPKINNLLEPRDYIIESRELLNALPEDTVIVADSFFTVDLADRDWVFDVNYFDFERENRKYPDYIVLKRQRYLDGNYEKMPKFEELGYKENEQISTDRVIIFTKS